MHATFMAKPYEEHAGSGMHVHISMLDAQGNNVFADDDGEDSALLKRALAGMIDLMPASMALLAPNVNAYRRFQPGMYVPTQASWGHNNRTVALRIPCGDRENHRVEYRVAGADANPYLVMAAILAGILHGLDNPLPLPQPVRQWSGAGGAAVADSPERCAVRVRTPARADPLAGRAFHPGLSRLQDGRTAAV